MWTVRSIIPWPGTLAANSSETPSSGWMWQTSTFGRRPSSSDDLERRVRRALELDRDRRLAPRQALAGADVERRVGPAPVVDVELGGDVGLGQRVRRDARLLAVARHLLALDVAAPVLAADDVLRARACAARAAPSPSRCAPSRR